MTCPRCGDALQSKSIDHIDVQVCPGCVGTLVAQRDLVRLLHTLGNQIPDDVDPDAVIEPLADIPGTAHCPKCRKAMTTFGYMGTNLVYADRCSDCWVLWTDPEELSVMAVLHARTNKRGRAQFDAHRKQRAEQNELMHKMVMARAASDEIASVATVGGSMTSRFRHQQGGISFGQVRRRPAGVWGWAPRWLWHHLDD